MTLEYVIKMLEARLDCMRRSSSGIDEDCTSEKCDDCDLNYAQGTIGEQQEALKEVISALQAQELSELKNNMDKKEILDGLYEIKNWKCGGDAKMHAVIEAAIKALEAQFEVPSAEPELCEDAVSRKAVYEAMVEKGQRSRRYRLGETWELNGAEIRETLDTVPPVTPKRKTGKWIEELRGIMVTEYRCSECGRLVRDDTGYDVAKDYPFCHCGAKMDGDEIRQAPDTIRSAQLWIPCTPEMMPMPNERCILLYSNGKISGGNYDYGNESFIVDFPDKDKSVRVMKWMPDTGEQKEIE